MDDAFFKVLSPEEEEQFRQWARDNFNYNLDPDPLWHPVVRDEWQKLLDNAINYGVQYRD